MNHTITSFQKHIKVLSELFSAKSEKENYLDLQEGEIYHYQHQEGIYSLIFNVLNYHRGKNALLEFSEEYNIDYIVIFFLKGLSFTTSDDNEHNIANAHGFVVMKADFNINVDFLQGRNAHHISFLLSSEAIKKQFGENAYQALSKLSFHFFDEHHDIILLRNALRQTFSYISEVKYKVQENLSFALLGMALEYIIRKSDYLDHSNQKIIGSNKNLLNKIIQVQNKIRTMLDEKPDVYELSKEFKLTSHELEENFQIIFGHSIPAYHLKQRIQKGRDLLVSQEMGAKEIAYHLGFSDLPHFSRTFKKEFGLSPRAYMQQYL
ncbi:helix-turn-helix domain-containing protein [Flammeovirga agarivorans]|uniref:Helix-turn-helix transcriptional regulator n=1 Tax=Flammeovirga agarivorans TaxID=2726742 RepID=A0A7X8SI69_9BACT|nr:AraC family transcriptional regulator [Flammeovirga agarivorans]NLR90686.1 helix-turn-helix transcriptional regulator [Flammeovirga agarivorans]